MWWYETRGGLTQGQFDQSKKSARGATLEIVKAGIGLGRRDDRVDFLYIHWQKRSKRSQGTAPALLSGT